MPTPRPERSARPAPRATAALLAVALAGPVLAACTAGETPAGGEEHSAQPTPEKRPRSQLAPVLQRLLDDRAHAIRHGRQRAFERTLAGGDAAALVTEERLFHNFTTLPLAHFGYELDDRGMRRNGDRVTARVWRSMQLRGYDTVPVRTLDRVRFERARGSRRGWLLRSGTDEEWREEHDVPLQAWDVERIAVQEHGGVLLVLDRESRGDAAALLDAIEKGVADVATRVPYPWDASVVVYALADRRFLRRLGDLPGGNPERLDAVTFPVRSEGVTGDLASTRVVLAPRMLRRREDVRDRLIRHELVHVALGARDDRVPTWLAEGLAEWVSAAGLPPEEQTIAGAAVEVAVDGVERLPADDTFHDDDAGVTYGIAWFACDYIADEYGEDGLWDLFDALRAAAGEETDEVLRERVGLDGDELADAAARRIVSTFG